MFLFVSTADSSIKVEEVSQKVEENNRLIRDMSQKLDGLCRKVEQLDKNDQVARATFATAVRQRKEAQAAAKSRRIGTQRSP